MLDVAILVDTTLRTRSGQTVNSAMTDGQVRPSPGT
jgi:hypothetical protein